MIARVWNGATRAADADRYLAHLNRAVIPELVKIDGHRGVQVLRRPNGDRYEFVVITFWDSKDAIRRFAGADTEAAVVAPEAQALLIDYDRRVTHYDVAPRDVVPSA